VAEDRHPGGRQEVERSLAYQRRNANEHQIHVDVTWGTENMFGHHMSALFPVDGTSAIGTVGQSPLITGVRVVKTKLGNIPERH
jgi:hypothetical protein